MRRLREHFSNTPRPVYIDTMDKVTKNYSNSLESKEIVDPKPESDHFDPQNGNFSPSLISTKHSQFEAKNEWNSN